MAQAAILEDAYTQGSRQANRPAGGFLEGPIVWERASLGDDDGVFRLDGQCLQELDELAALMRANPLPMLLREAGDLPMPACRQLMAGAKHSLAQGPGFAILDRLPVGQYDADTIAAMFWVLSQLVARPVAQSWDGKMIYDVRDKGMAPGNGVRPDVTNAEQNFHTDNSYNLYPPDYVALFCLQPAKSGGISSIVSFYSIHNEMQRRHPELLERLYQPYLFDRQREHAPGDAPVLSHPLFQYVDGRLVCRLSRLQVINGHKLAGVPLDREGEEALECLEAIMKEPRWNKEFFFEAGQVQILDNTRCGHRRTGFVDHPEPQRRRHLLRLWLRDAGRRFYNG